ncbi:hypothetical protein [Kribbella sp. NPDC055071]
MSSFPKSPLRTATRLGATAAIGVSIIGLAAAPAHASQISQRIATGIPTESICNDIGSSQARQQHASTWYCYPQYGAWSLDLIWFT